MSTNPTPLLEIEALSVDIPMPNGVLHAVRDVSFKLNKGEALGIVGESGSGKSMSTLALMGLLPASARRRATKLNFAQNNLLEMSDQDFARDISGDRLSMIFQEPMTSLNPVYTIGRQLTETMLLHGKCGQSEATERALYLLDRVGLPDARSRLSQYPHQLSGGQRQRVMIALALMNEPDLIIADEPTTALDVTVQAQILRLLTELREEFGMAMILISHDLGAISRTVDKVAVMYAGQLIEMGSVRDVLERPLHPYTEGLLKCTPNASGTVNGKLGTIAGIVPSLIGTMKGCSFANRCDHATDACQRDIPLSQGSLSQSGLTSSVGSDRYYRCILPVEWKSRMEKQSEAIFTDNSSSSLSSCSDKAGETVLSANGVSCHFQVRRSFFAASETLKAVDELNLELKRGEILALVGESGCGKSTLAKMLLGLQKPTGGEILLDGNPLDLTNSFERSKRIQPVFQDPYSSLNPRKTIGQTIIRPLDLHNVGAPDKRRFEVEQVMELVGLPRRYYHSYPNQVSGGQRQRVAIARAIIMKPEILICDEPTSALDVSVQSQILNLLLDLRQELGMTYLIITHDLSVVEYMATRIAVMYLGQMVELGAKEKLFYEPLHPYTKVLLQSLLKMEPGKAIPDAGLGSAYPNALDMPGGCRFHPRCPVALEQCSHVEPLPGTNNVRCHLYDMVGINNEILSKPSSADTGQVM